MKKVKNNLSKLGIFLTCLTLSVVLGTSAFATGLLDPLFSYFRSDEEVYLEEILAPAETVSNENVQIRLEGAIADESTCYMVVSLIGFSASEKKQIEKADIHNEIEIYGLFEDGARVMGARKSAATYVQGKKAKSLFPDATRTSVIAYTPKTCGISDVEKVCFSYGGLVLEVLPENYLTECYKLDAGINQNISAIQLSRVGFSFTQSISGESEPDEFVYDIRLIRDDGTVLTAEEMRGIGYSHDFSMGADLGETKIVGNWGQMPSITILNLDDYSGLQINGENYYYEKKDCGAVESGTFASDRTTYRKMQDDNFEIPEAARIILLDFLDACENNPENASSFCHFETYDEREAFEKAIKLNGLLSYEVLDVVTLSERLYAIKIHLTKEEKDIPERFYYVGEISGQFWVMNNMGNVPASLQGDIKTEVLDSFKQGK